MVLEYLRSQAAFYDDTLKILNRRIPELEMEISKSL
ncbi:unnamed protein product [Protopolystoma xenopodis]|uniref:Uncharacterized protein n=1 Tax=Protopolystoma xenopodis TaxID=117903 RepID=A0A3S5AJC1_9PLAT|nr:unnamed protein product [Protopolystoma xenopodis]